MPFYVARRCVQKLIESGKDLKNSKILVMGITFKENVSDIRNSKVAELVKELKSFGLHVDIVDPHTTSGEVEHEYGFRLAEKNGYSYETIILAVAHKEYTNLDENYFMSIAAEGCVLIDIKGIYRNKFKQLNYWSL